MPTRPSLPARTIAEALRADNLEVPPFKVQFWAESGLLGPSRRSWPGGGGSTVDYPADALEVARLIHFLPRADRQRPQVVLACFSRGLDVDVDELRAALVAEVTAVRDAVASAPVAHDDEDAALAGAEEVAAAWVARRRRPAQLRRWAQNASTRAPEGGAEISDADFSGSDETLRFVLTPVAAAFGGDNSYLVDRTMGGLLAAVGADDAMNIAVAESGRHRVDLEAEAAKNAAVMIERLEETATTVDVEEMTQARRVVVALARVGDDPAALVPVEGPLAPLGTSCQYVAMSALGLVVLARHGGIALAALAELLGSPRA